LKETKISEVVAWAMDKSKNQLSKANRMTVSYLSVYANMTLLEFLEAGQKARPSSISALDGRNLKTFDSLHINTNIKNFIHTRGSLIESHIIANYTLKNHSLYFWNLNGFGGLL